MSKKILVVDDDKEDLNAIHKALDSKGYEITTVDNGAEAFDIAKEEHFDLILIDIKMPTLSGYDLVNLLRQQIQNKSKLMFISVVPKSEVELQGVDGFIQKPFSPGELLSNIEKVVG